MPCSFTYFKNLIIKVLLFSGTELLETLRDLQGGCQEDGVTLLGGAKQKDKRQWSETDVQEVLHEYEEKLYCEGD